MQIEKKVERLCGAKPAAFLVGLYPVVQELVSFVNGECTWLFSFACGKDWENRWDLLILYNDLIADMWGCAKELSGESAAC